MSRAQSLSAVVVAFVSGVLVGLWGVRSRDSAQPAASGSAQSDSLRSTVEALQAENRQLKDNLARVRASPPAATDPAAKSGTTFTPLQELSALADLQRRKLVRPAITFLDRKGKLDGSFVGLFSLTDTERDRLQQAVDGTREKLASLERDNAKITQDDHGNIVVTVQPFPEAGGKVYDEIMQTFADVLGPERNEIYRQVGAEQFENSLGKFGAAERTYTFGYDSTERAGQPYTFVDKVVQRTANGGTWGNTDSTRFQTFDELKARVGPIVSILPPDYKRSK